MKQIIHKIGSFLMALIVLFSTFSFTVHQHYCGDELKDTSVFFEAEKCEMEKMMVETSCEAHQKKKTCCEDVIDVVEGQDELNITLDTLSLDQQLFVASFTYTYINLFEGLEKNVNSYRNYIPPLVVRPIFKLDESYLI